MGICELCLVFRWVSQFRDIFEEDNYHPIHVNTLLEYQDILKTFPYESPSLENSNFPKQFPFSGMVPRVYNEVQTFILSCLEFSEDLQLTQADLGIKILFEWSTKTITALFSRRNGP